MTLENHIRPTYTIVPDGIYHPSELKLNLPGCTSIAVGYCSDTDRWRTKWTLRGRKKYILKKFNWSIALAHAHGSSFCVRDGRFIFRDKDVPDEVIWHEYAHILADCNLHDHDSVWQNYARQLGIPDPTPYTKYGYYGEPKVVWGRAS